MAIYKSSKNNVRNRWGDAHRAVLFHRYIGSQPQQGRMIFLVCFVCMVCMPEDSWTPLTTTTTCRYRNTLPCYGRGCPLTAWVGREARGGAGGGENGPRRDHENIMAHNNISAIPHIRTFGSSVPARAMEKKRKKNTHATPKLCCMYKQGKSPPLSIDLIFVVYYLLSVSRCTQDCSSFVFRIIR
jgi:hypothetical protein